MSSLSKLGTAAAVVKRQTSVVKTNQMTYCSFCGARGVSASQNKWGVKISTLETKKLHAKAYTSNLGWHVKTKQHPLAWLQIPMNFLYTANTTQSQQKIPFDLWYSAFKVSKWLTVLSSLYVFILKAALSRDQKNLPPDLLCLAVPQWQVQTPPEKHPATW